MILSGPGNAPCGSKAALSISLSIIFSAVKQTRRCEPGQTISVKHATSQETPLLIYLGLKLHSVTHKHKFIDKCFDLGLCSSYQRVIKLSCKLANRVCAKYNAEQIVCPPALRGNLFTDAASITPCTHEEAGWRMLLHCHHAAEQSAKRVAIRTVDTDVVVLAVSSFANLNIDELWITFGIGKNVRLIPVHELLHQLESINQNH